MPESAKLKLVFMGTPDFSSVILKQILDWPKGEVVAVYTQPDRPAGRGKRVQASSTKELAVKHGLAVQQPPNFKSDDNIASLAKLKPDFLLVVAYGLILPQAVLDIPRIAPVNVHASLLPKYRGAAPIQRAVMNGDTKTGITIMHMDAGLDTGPIYAMRELPIGPDDTARAVHDTLSRLGGELLLETLPGIAQGKITAIPQNSAEATYAPKLNKGSGQVDFAKTASQVHNQVRGASPWPGAWCVLQQEQNGTTVRIRVCPGQSGMSETDAPPGTVLGLVDDSLAIQCVSGVYLIPQMCPANSKMMTAPEFVCGYLHQARAWKAVFSNE
jgi:methionyl-tRNA formyltransferase